jgi:hypothetical protein
VIAMLMRQITMCGCQLSDLQVTCGPTAIETELSTALTMLFGAIN